MTIQQIKKQLRKLSNKKKAKILQSFFKTGPGEYGEGDIFIGVKVPEIRKIVKAHAALDLKSVKELIKSKIHEERLCAVLILVARYQAGAEQEKERIYKLYLKHTKYINNWDLVDLSAYHIVGEYLFKKSKKPLTDLARSSILWERRIAIVATYFFIKNNKFNETIRIAKKLLHDKEDLIHKAVGWMLREVGKRDKTTLVGFLKQHHKTMPRTMLRYAIEKFPETERQRFLRKD